MTSEHYKKEKMFINNKFLYISVYNTYMDTIQYKPVGLHYSYQFGTVQNVL